MHFTWHIILALIIIICGKGVTCYFYKNQMKCICYNVEAPLAPANQVNDAPVMDQPALPGPIIEAQAQDQAPVVPAQVQEPPPHSNSSPTEIPSSIIKIR